MELGDRLGQVGLGWFVHSGAMVGNTILSGECPLTLVTFIRKYVREMFGLHMVADVRAAAVGEVITEAAVVPPCGGIPCNIL